MRRGKELLKTIIDSNDPGCLRMCPRYQRRESEMRMQEGIHVGKMEYAKDNQPAIDISISPIDSLLYHYWI